MNGATDENLSFEAAVRGLGACAADFRRPEFVNALTLPELVRAERLASEAFGYLAQLSYLRRKWLKECKEAAP